MTTANRKSKTIRIGIDTGGTFTDFVFELDGSLQIFKVLSTPHDPSVAIASGLERIAQITATNLRKIEVVHGTTVGTNALLERRGARTALITTHGFEDVLVIGRQARPELYNLNAIKPPPLVPDHLRFGIRERVAASGEVLEELDENQLDELILKLREEGVECVAVSLLFSFVHPDHERRIAAALASLNIPISISHKILPEYREYERTSTVTINAYLQPLMGSYLNNLEKLVPELRVMQSSGGSISAAAAAAEPVRTILSGPAGGVVGALRTAKVAGYENIITFDMGGTSTDVALCDRTGLRTTNEAVVAGLPVAVPVMDIHTVGAGGGSIARVDEGGSLRVGPESAGADPGPACYGRSLLPTVTDAHVVLGHFGGAGLLGGEFALDESRASQAIAALANDLSKAAGRKLSLLQAAQGIVSVANTNMERALRTISVERGHDPREFVLLPFGGAGGLHAVDLARALRIPLVIAPTYPGALSAIGVATSDVLKDQSRTVMLAAEFGVDKTLESTFTELQRSARRVLRSEGFDDSKQRHERSLFVRYRGQSFELEIKPRKLDAKSIAGEFHRAHKARYGYAQEMNVVEIVSTRLRSIGLVDPLKRAKAAKPRALLGRPNAFGVAHFEGRKHRVAIYRRDDLRPGMRLRSPCIVTEYSATTLVPSGARATIDGYGNLIIEI